MGTGPCQDWEWSCDLYDVISFLKLDATAIAVLNDTQRRAVDYVIERSRADSERAYPSLVKRACALGYLEKDVQRFDTFLHLHAHMPRPSCHTLSGPFIGYGTRLQSSFTSGWNGFLGSWSKIHTTGTSLRPGPVGEALTLVQGDPGRWVWPSGAGGNRCDNVHDLSAVSLGQHIQ